MGVMPKFVATVVIENKRGLSDPEGETILRDLVLKGARDEAGGGGARGSGIISEIRTAKMLRMAVDSQDAESAVRDVRRVCDALHLYNPIVSSVDITAEPRPE